MFRLFYDKLKNFLEESSYKKQRILLINSAENIDEAKKYELKKLVKSGKSVIGYVPYLAGQTELIIFNFFATNYGVRSKSTIVISVTDKNFIPIYSTAHSLGYRENIINKTKFFSNKSTAVFCTVILLNEHIRANHASHGGHFRFWGSWSNFSAFTHSMPLPPQSNLFRSLGNKFFRGKALRNICDRRFYPQEVKQVKHFSPINGAICITDRGDLSPQLDLNMGFSLLGSNNSLIFACYHNSPYTRGFINTLTLRDHIVALPDIESLDAHLYFGECSKPGAKFLVSLFRSDLELNPVEEIEMEVKNFEPVRLSALFPNLNCVGKVPCWVRFRPISGFHREYYVNVIYSRNDLMRLYDGVHSHGFTFGGADKSIKFTGRTLKFSPFKISVHDDYPEGLKRTYHASLAIWGHESEEIRYRLRIFSDSDRNFEIISQSSINPKTVKFINLNNLLASQDLKAEFFIAQLESEESNLNASMFCWSNLTNSSLQSIGVDHLTGG